MTSDVLISRLPVCCAAIMGLAGLDDLIPRPDFFAAQMRRSAQCRGVEIRLTSAVSSRRARCPGKSLEGAMSSGRGLLLGLALALLQPAVVSADEPVGYISAKEM